MFKPMWVLVARFILTELGRPTPPKSAIELGCVVKKTKKNAENDAKYKVQPDSYLGFKVLATDLQVKSNRAK
jgi:hypothetical protein